MDDFDDLIARTSKGFEDRFEEGLETNHLPPIAENPPEDHILKRLKKHQFYKTVLKCTIGTPVRRRVTVGTFTPDIDTGQQTQGAVKRTEDVTLKSLLGEIDNLRKKDPHKCIAERESNRKTLDRMGNCVQWLRKKPERSIIENRYLRRGMVEDLNEVVTGNRKVENYRKWYNHFLSKSRPGDKFVSREAVGLHILDEYFHKNDEDIYVFFSNLDKSKSGMVDWQTVVEALEQRNVPLKMYEFLQALTVLQCYEGDKMNYENFCGKMEHFRKYKWGRLMSKTSNYCKNLLTSLDDAKFQESYRFLERGYKRFRAGAKTTLPVLSGPLDFVKRRERPIKKAKILLDIPSQTSTKTPGGKKINRKFWPGTNLDKLYPCYMPLDRRHPDETRHPLFEIIRFEKLANKQHVRLPPFTGYTIYDKDKKI